MAHDSKDKQNQPKPDFSNVRSGSSSTAPSPAHTGEERVYTVQAGDSLSEIARRHYGDTQAWHRIYEANRDQIKDPDLIQPGWKLRLP